MGGENVLFESFATVFGQPLTGLEVVAFVSGLASVWLTVKLNIFNWPMGLVSVACYSVVFFHAKLYADSMLQIFFFAACIYGWWAWARRGRAAAAPRAVTNASKGEWVVVMVTGAVSIAMLSLWLQRHTDSPAPVLDSSIFVLSLLATWWQARKRIESWWLWIAVDVISIPLYWSRSLPLTSILYGIFLFMCIVGLGAWRRDLADAGAPA